MNTIAVLTSGGDAPGMNAAIRAVVRSAIEKGMRVMGVRRGFNGLMHGDIFEMTLRSVSNIIERGGTILYTARCPEFRTEEGVQKALNTCKYLGIDGLVVIGGDGSFRGAKELSEHGLPTVGVPGTIDNDIACCDRTIGYDTAMNTIVEMVDRLRDTSESHDRCSVIEVMGRHAGYLALNGGIAVGATSVLIPEFEYDFERDVIDRMKRTRRTGKKNFIIVAAEGIKDEIEPMAAAIEEATGVETRYTNLGHVQRGGSPTACDRVLGSKMGYWAVELLSQDIGNRVVAQKDGKIVDFDIFEALSMEKHIEEREYKVAYDISI
ncbi:MAG: 6-phosphofructokinase [Ruminococcaceae bacterium]|nr:6-phosphofructokinase [Oscillospiraceae bacterium]